MKHIFTGIGQYLAAPLFVAAILGAHGCSDSGTVNPVAQLASLTVSPGTLQPSFAGDITNYDVDLTSDITTVTVTAQPAVAGDSVNINGQATTSRATTLGPEGSTTPVSIVVSESGSNSRTYTVLINRAGLGGNNSLRTLVVSPGILNPPTFDKNELIYEVDVPSAVGSIEVTPTLDDPNATMTVNGQAAISGQPRTATLNPVGQSTSITVIVTAQNGNQKPYLVTVNRAPLDGNNNLQSLTVSPETLIPAFNQHNTLRTSFTVSVGGHVDSVTVTAAPQDAIASLTINDQATKSLFVPLPVGPSSTEIEILVTAQNQSQKLYLITVDRAAIAAPPAPTIAPDLISEDDSCLRGPVTNQCFPGTSDEDNITNVTMPRFRIPQPAARETPSLYVDGTKVASEFDPAANTLKPTAALNDGPYRITSRVTNSAGLESTQSPFLDVTINTTGPVSP